MAQRQRGLADGSELVLVGMEADSSSTCGGDDVDRLGNGLPSPRVFFSKNVILKALHVRMAQEFDSKGFAGGGS